MYINNQLRTIKFFKYQSKFLKLKRNDSDNNVYFKRKW